LRVRLELTRVKHPKGSQSLDKLLTLLANIGLGLKGPTKTYTLVKYEHL
jgi:hypothetical protein